MMIRNVPHVPVVKHKHQCCRLILSGPFRALPLLLTASMVLAALKPVVHADAPVDLPHPNLVPTKPVRSVSGARALRRLPMLLLLLLSKQK